MSSLIGGAGGGKICFIATQIVGPTGKVIGVDCNREMLTLARTAREVVGGLSAVDRTYARYYQPPLQRNRHRESV